MNEVEKQAFQTFHSNMHYFAKHHPELHRKLTLFNAAIETGRYKERYALEYKNGGYFDLLDLQTGEWLYGKSSIEHAEKLAKEIDYTKVNGVIETFYNFKFDDDAVKTAEKTGPEVSKFATMAPVIGYIDKIVDKNTTMKQIYKFIFLGVGLGLHLTKLHQKLRSGVYLIVEDNLEIFRASMFVTDYSMLGNESRLYFSVMENAEGFRNVFNNYFTDAVIRNSYLKYALFYPEYESKIKQIQNFIVTQPALTYTHDRLLKKNILVLERVHERARFFDVSAIHKDSPLAKERAVFVAAGPSLNKNIEWLKKNASKTFVVAVFMVAPILEKHGIKPDVLIHIDEALEPVMGTLGKMESFEFFKDVTFFLAPSVAMEAFDLVADRERCYFFEDRTSYRFASGNLQGYSVGEIGYALTLIWGCGEIYLLGLDLALDPETGETHARGHASEGQKPLQSPEGNDEVASLRGTTLQIRGNFREYVKTTPLFDVSVSRMNYFSKNLKQPFQRVYNLNDGAFFENCIPTKPQEVDFSDLPEKNAELSRDVDSFFRRHSGDTMSDAEKKALRERFREADRKIDDVRQFSKKKFPSIEQYHSAFVDTVSRLIVSSGPHSGELSAILVIYLENIGGYVGDFFNTKEIDNPKRHIKQLHKIVCRQLERLISCYRDALEGECGKPHRSEDR